MLRTSLLRLLPSLAVSLFFFSAAYSADVANIALPKGISAGPAYGGMSEYRLDNGLTILLYPDSSKPRILVNVTYKVGSKHENYGETGMAHLLEHLMFKGSPGFENIDSEFTKRGMSNNGSTWMDRTNYFEVMPASEDNLAWAIAMEASRMTGAYIAKKDLDSEMTVVRNEMEMGETNPFSVAMQSMLAQAFMWHNYGNDSIGARSDVENVPIAKLQAFYRMYYQPDNAVLIVAGPIDVAKTLALIQKNFAKIPKPTRQLPVFYTREPTQDGERESTIRRIAGTPLLLLGYHAPGGAHPDSVAMNTLLRVLADAETGRLRESLVNAGLATSAQSFALTFQESSMASFSFSFDKKHDIAKARALALAEIEAAKPVTEVEFQRAKRAYLNELKSGLDDVSRVGLSLSEYIAMGDWRLFFVEREQLDALKISDLDRVAKTYLLASNRTAVNYLPDGAPKRADIPAPPDLAAQLASLKPDQQNTVAAGEQLDLTPAALAKRIRYQRLRDGLELAMLPKKSRNSAVNFSLSLRMGDADSLRTQMHALSAAADMLNRGTNALDRIAFADALSANEAEFGISASGQTLEVSGRATAATLAKTLELITAALKTPRFDAKEFETWRKEQLTALDAAENDPQTRAARAISAATNPYPAGHALAAQSLEQDRVAIKALSLEALKKAHAKFIGAHAMIAVFVGEFDAASVAKIMQENFANWRAPQAFVEIPELANRTPERHLWINTPDQANGILIAALPIALQDSDSDFALATIANYLLGGSGLDSRVMERLRQKDGVSYGGGTGISVSSSSKASLWQAYAIAAPENLMASEKAILEELARFEKSGISAEELSKAQTGLSKSKRVQWSDDARLIASIAAQMQQNRRMDFSTELEARIANATVAAVNSYIKKTLAPERWGFVLAGDAAKAKTKK
jgi:zinc protease